MVLKCSSNNCCSKDPLGKLKKPLRKIPSLFPLSPSFFKKLFISTFWYIRRSSNSCLCIKRINPNYCFQYMYCIGNCAAIWPAYHGISQSVPISKCEFKQIWLVFYKNRILAIQPLVCL
jgi:hypothetical protein